MEYVWVHAPVNGTEPLSKWHLINQNTNAVIMTLYLNDSVPDAWNQKLKKKLTHSYLWYLEKLVFWRVWNCNR